MKGNPAQEDWEYLASLNGDDSRRKAALESAFPAKMELVPLEEALKSANVPEATEVAEACKENADKLKGVDVELMSYVFAYTFDFGDESLNKDNPYSKINAALLKGVFLDIRKVRDLIFGLLSALRTLPYGSFDILYRGLKNRVEWSKGDVKLWPSFTSTTLDMEAAKGFIHAESDGQAYGTLLIIHQAMGYDLRNVSLFKEEEVLIEPGIRVQVKSVIPGSFVLADVDVIEWSDNLLDLIPRFDPFDKAVKLIRDGELKEGVDMLKELCDKKNEKAMVKYGKMLVYGGCIVKDEKKGFELLREGCKNGDGDGLYELGRCYEMGIGTEKNEYESQRAYMMSFLQGGSVTHSKIEEVMQKRPSITDEFRREFEEMKKKAELGDAECQFIYAKCFRVGVFVPKNDSEATRLYRLSAEQGNARAQNNLGSCYLNGVGVYMDTSEGIRLLRLSSEQGYGPAMFNLGRCYEDGIGVSKDISEAIRLYQLSADKSYGPALRRICFLTVDIY